MPSTSRAKPTMATHMGALRNDVAVSIQTLAKGKGVKAATLHDLKKWLDGAVKSPTDAVSPLKKGWTVGTGAVGVPVLNEKQLKEVLKGIETRINLTAKGEGVKKPSAAELRAWVTQTLVDSAEGTVKVTKAGKTRPATAAEIRNWIGN